MNFNIGIMGDSGPTHKHNNYEIIIYTKGEGVFHSENISFPISPGKIIIVPPGTMHNTTTHSSVSRFYICGQLGQFFNLTRPEVVLDNEEKEGLFLARMIYNNRFSSPNYVELLIHAFSNFLLQGIKMENDVFMSVNKIIEEISSNFYKFDINLSAILKKSGYSEDYIRAKFKSITGKSPVEFLTEIRISHACYLIDVYKSTISLLSISEKCGFNDYVYFSRRFKKFMGISPRKYLDEK